MSTPTSRSLYYGANPLKRPSKDDLTRVTGRPMPHLQQAQELLKPYLVFSTLRSVQALRILANLIGRDYGIFKITQLAYLLGMSSRIAEYKLIDEFLHIAIQDINANSVFNVEIVHVFDHSEEREKTKNEEEILPDEVAFIVIEKERYENCPKQLAGNLVRIANFNPLEALEYAVQMDNRNLTSEFVSELRIAEHKASHMTTGGRRFYLKRWIKGNIDRINGATSQKNKAAEKAVALMQAEECFNVRGQYCSPRDSYTCTVCQQVFKTK
ncbi:hypothetical protein [Halodesulfovibrio marinisediminis]|uniref:Uncharacterized protein n=1 Tax=Halodesulfovibrio marinisediminis DSM 17456 TaxID=1121457 RepID=A0A1N6J3S4_9BACT|nr:hypothetical protein [Halodesulfovibrio marinisediminis]SIO38940.1 hypothetical protein SAMN02745161_3126 [Halodesulfovibrio marinisediminis DSM 17456]